MPSCLFCKRQRSTYVVQKLPKKQIPVNGTTGVSNRPQNPIDPMTRMSYKVTADEAREILSTVAEQNGHASKIPESPESQRSVKITSSTSGDSQNTQIITSPVFEKEKQKSDTVPVPKIEQNEQANKTVSPISDKKLNNYTTEETVYEKYDEIPVASLPEKQQNGQVNETVLSSSDKKQNTSTSVTVASVPEQEQNGHVNETVSSISDKKQNISTSVTAASVPEREQNGHVNETVSPISGKKQNTLTVTVASVPEKGQNGHVNETVPSISDKTQNTSTVTVASVHEKEQNGHVSETVSSIYDKKQNISTSVTVASIPEKEQNDQVTKSVSFVSEDEHEYQRIESVLPVPEPEQNHKSKHNKEQAKKAAPAPPIPKVTSGNSDLISEHKESIEDETTPTITVEPSKDTLKREQSKDESNDEPIRRRSGVVPSAPVKYDKNSSDKLPNYPKDPDDEALIKAAIEKNDFLSKILSGQRLDDVITAMYNKEIASKETIIKQGDKGSHMYVSAKGRFQVSVKGKVFVEFDDVRVFGELAILYNAKRLATIKALTPGRVWVLDRSVYQQIMLKYNIQERDEIMEFLMNNKILNVVGKDALQEVANLLKSEFFSTGKQIVKQGDKGHKFYIIRAGTVTITKEGEGVVGNYKKGDCFGELALLKEDSRQATVTADAPGVECLTLTRKEFLDHFEEIDSFTKIELSPQDSIKNVLPEHEDVNLDDLKIIATLGVGGFGRVELVQHRKKKDLVFALKYLKKIDIVLQHQEQHVHNEKNIQMGCKSPFIIRLYRTYKDNKYIYLLMESCLGGDLWSLLQKQRTRRFDEKEARFIAGCVLEAFDYLHSRSIIYRDLKPENLLVAINGYIKLTDFGFAKKVSARGRTFTFAGTPEYVAPEIVLNRGHDRAVDYWAFGAFIFELLTGRTPFRTDDSSHMKTYNKILNGIDNVGFPSYVNLKARHIVEKLCRPVPSERLGMQRGGIKDIKAHKWFLGFDWQKFARCEIPSPFRPKLKGPVDTQHFDQFKEDKDVPPDEISGWDEDF